MSITRYTRPAMGALWTEQEKWYRVIQVWSLTLAAQAALAPSDQPLQDAAVKLKRWLETNGKQGVNADEINQIENEITKHDILAAQQWLRAKLDSPSLPIHQGLTSSDALDTAFSLQLNEACIMIEHDLAQLNAVLLRQAETHRHTRMVGRTHAVHAEPTTFGLKLLGHYAEFQRNLERFKSVRIQELTVMLSGAVGTYAHLDPQVEVHVAAALGLRIEPVSTQVIPRDRHAVIVIHLGIIAGAVERLAINLRLLQQTEIGEVQEFFTETQEGSSAMPHKRNPIGGENLTGQARIIRATVSAILENIATWHERDIAHSAVERQCLPDAFIALDYALSRLTTQVDRMFIHPDRMAANLARSPVQSGALRNALVSAGLVPAKAYTLVKTLAQQSIQCGTPFLDVVTADPKVAGLLDRDGLSSVFSLERHFNHLDMIFDRVLAEA